MFSVKNVDHMAATESIVSDVVRVSTERSPLGLSVTAALADGTSWQFGPCAPGDYSGPASTVYVMNEDGKTVADYQLYPGEQAAWDALKDAPQELETA